MQAVGVGGEAFANKNKDDMDIDERQIRAGINALESPREGMDVTSPFKEGLLDDWEAVEALWDHILRCALCRVVHMGYRKVLVLLGLM
jgi:actin-related protein